VRFVLNALYVLLLLAVSPWLIAAAVRRGKYRAGWREKLLGLVPVRSGSAPCAWIHAVSLGEVSLIAPLVRELGMNRPDCEIAISTTTLTGHALAKSRYPELCVFYCPLDFSWAVRRAIMRLRPSVLVLAELELWPNLIRECRRAQVPVAIVNARLSDRSFRGYSRFRWFARRLLSMVNVIAAQNELYADRFRRLGAARENVSVAGSLKFDGAETDRDNPATQRLRQLAGLASEDIVFLAGSTQEPEEQLAIQTFRLLSGRYPRLRLVIVPRHPERFAAVAELLAASGLAWQRRSELDQPGGKIDGRVLLVDRVGELAAWWGTATIAYVGGSMGAREGQNMIEPAAYGAAVSFGPRTRNFRDVVQALLGSEAAVVVHDQDELTTFVGRCLDDPAYANQLGERARSVVASQLGATRRTLDLIERLLPEAEQTDTVRSAA
jgi:3-deoxy-D-manno-octulosonic-acid transferase